MSGNARRLAEAANQIINSQPVTEAYKAGDTVKVPHKGKMVRGKIVRYDDGGTDKARQSGGGYVVDVGEPASILVPANKVVKEAANQIDEISKATKDAYVAKRGSQLSSMLSGHTKGKQLTGKQQANAVKGIKQAMGVKEETAEVEESVKQIDELTKMRRLGQTVGALMHGKPTPSDRLRDAQDKLAHKRYWTPERLAQQAEIDAKIRKSNAAAAIEQIKRILNDHDKQERAMIISGIKSIKESAEITEAPYTPANDYEGEMAMTQLKSVIEKATETLAMLKPEAKMEAWVQSKITLCDEHISCVRDYLKHTPGAVS
jgi:hypothetical protein